MKNPLIIGNAKMGKQVAIFNLPPVVTCTPTSWCLGGKCGRPACYALRNNYLLPSVVRAAETRLAFSNSDDFVPRMVEAIRKCGKTFFRFHSSGDFYSADYIRKVTAIARACPNVLFRATTRRRDFSKSLRQLNDEPNFIVRESLDDERNKPQMGLPFAALDHLPIVAAEPNVIRCQRSCDACNHSCWLSRGNTCFSEH